ncbi:MAG: amidohydrolase family protein [Gammaproteobacteria bacterium]|nr:amidohydrolase family protein [Gammaproteobacteria bacterium]
MIIDVHTHVNNYEQDRQRSTRECIDALEEAMARNGVDYALTLTSYKVDEHRPCVREVVEAVRDRPRIGVIAGISYLNYRERDLREVADYLREGLVKGLKLYPGYEPFYPYDSRCRVIYDLAMEFDVPVMIHAGDTYTPRAKVRYAHPLNVDDVAVDNPALKLVICHLGNPWIRDCMEVVYKNSNVYADVSGLVLGHFEDRFEQYMLGQIREMILYAGEPRYLLYGTDWPISSMETYLKFMNGLGLTDEALEHIMWKNAARLFRIDGASPGEDPPEPSGTKRNLWKI